MAVEQLRRDLPHILRAAETRHAVCLPFAHEAAQPQGGIGAFVVQGGFNGVDQVLFLTLHAAFREAAVLQAGMIQHLLQKIQHGRKNRLALRQKIVLDEVGVKAGQLDLSLQAHQRAEGRAVQLVQTHGNAADIGVTLRAAQKHAGQQRIQSGVFFAVRPPKVHAEAARFEFIRLHGMQAHARYDRELLYHNDHPFCPLLYTLFAKRKACKK